MLGGPLALEYLDARPGDPRRTDADVTRAARDLGYRPETTLATGLACQLQSLHAAQAATVVAA
jgi:nucleoside-diphosphate-sugar epimerase